jgi:putrescine transport system ATP-binding protein
MDQGRLVQVATPAVIYESPNTRYVADFIGDVNFLSGKISQLGETEITLDSDEVACPIIAAHETNEGAQGGAVGDDAWLAIRPEKMRISLDPPEDASINCASGEVWDIGYLGDLSVYHVRLENGHVIKSTVTNQTRLIERPIGWEDKVWLSWPRDAGIVLTR